jgi:hypothetical protein
VPLNPLPGQSNAGVIYLLDKSYSLIIENVEWSDNQNDPTPAKNSIEGNSFDFHATKIGRIDGEAIGHLRVTDLYDAKPNRFWSSVILRKLGWGASSENVVVKLYANGKPVKNSEDFYFGQKLMLTIKLFKADSTEIANFAVDQPKWKIEEPVISRLNIANDFSTGKYVDWYGENATATYFYLFDYDQSKTTKTISFSGEIITPDFKTTASVTNVLKYKRPIVVEQAFETSIPKVATLTADGRWYIGFDSKIKQGIIFEPNLLNDSGINYRVNCLQLIKIDCEREVASEGKIIKEYLKTTLKKQKSIEIPSNYWLDASYPARFGNYGDVPVSSSGEQVLEKFYIDSPRVYLEDKGKDVRYVKARMDFYFFILAMPDIKGSERFPIGKKVKWYWEGSAEKVSDSLWLPAGHLNFPRPEQLEFNALPGWSNISTGTKPLKWLQKEEE